ncbi:MAG: hypothetical protein IKV61_02485 [Clostridia bacterium]|nr:hypothetical protein [Clostridia bacterium]
MKNFEMFFANLKNSKIVNNFINGTKILLRNVLKHLNAIFLVLFFIIKFVLPKLVLPKYLCLPTFDNVLLGETLSLTSLQQETLLFIMISQFMVKFTIEISVLFLTAVMVVALAIFSVCFYLNKKEFATQSNPVTISNVSAISFYTHKVQFLN